MDKSTERLVQAEGTAALLDRGVSVPLKELRIPFRKKPLKMRVVMRRPRLGGLIRLARVYLLLGVTAEQMKKFTKEEDKPPPAGGRNSLGGEELDGSGVPGRGHAQVHLPAGYRPFYEYYQVSREDEPDEAETEPKKEGELKTVY